MITLGDWLIPVFNIAAAGFIVIMVFFGARKGFLPQLVRLVASVAAIFIAWKASPVVAEYIPLWPSDAVPLAQTVIGSALYEYLNRIAWFLVLLVVLRVVFFLLERLAKGIEKVLPLKTLGRILGGILGLIEGGVWIIVIVFVLYTPIFANGSSFVKHTWVEAVADNIGGVFNDTVLPVLSEKDLSELIDDAGSLTSQETRRLIEWLRDNGYISN